MVSSSQNEGNRRECDLIAQEMASRTPAKTASPFGKEKLGKSATRMVEIPGMQFTRSSLVSPKACERSFQNVYIILDFLGGVDLGIMTKKHVICRDMPSHPIMNSPTHLFLPYYDGEMRINKPIVVLMHRFHCRKEYSLYFCTGQSLKYLFLM